MDKAPRKRIQWYAPPMDMKVYQKVFPACYEGGIGNLRIDPRGGNYLSIVGFVEEHEYKGVSRDCLNVEKGSIYLRFAGGEEAEFGLSGIDAVRFVQDHIKLIPLRYLPLVAVDAVPEL